MSLYDLPLTALYGMPIVEEPLMADTVWEQVRFPRSKKVRIRKKWAKNRDNYRVRIVPWDKVYELAGVMYAHPIVVERLKRELEQVSRLRRGIRP